MVNEFGVQTIALKTSEKSDVLGVGKGVEGNSFFYLLISYTILESVLVNVFVRTDKVAGRAWTKLVQTRSNTCIS